MLRFTRNDSTECYQENHGEGVMCHLSYEQVHPLIKKSPIWYTAGWMGVVGSSEKDKNSRTHLVSG